MKGGNSCRITDFRRNRLHILFCDLFEFIQMLKKPLSAFFEYFCIFGIHHAVDKIVDLGLFDSGKIISDRNVKLESVCCSKAKFLRHYMKHKPCFDIFSHGLRHIQFRGPLTVITLVLCQNARTVDTCSQLFSIHFLYRFQLKETGAGIVGCNDILCQLCVWTCSRSDGSFQISSENLHVFISRSCIRAMYPKYGSFCLLFFQYPIHDLPERHTGHYFTHDRSSFSRSYFPLFMSSASSFAA